jgi:NADP-dependent 3-hydroxy acid dehydrogenase YdfG
VSITDLFRLDGKVAVVTGASSGLGVACAQALAEAGADVVLAARRAEALAETAKLVEAAGRRALAVPTDVSDPDACARLVDAAVAEFGRLDVMINNAGLAIYGPVENMSETDIDLMVDTNLKGTLHGSIAAFKVMKAQRSGLIVNISSIAGKLHLPNEAVYCATKWGVNGFSGVLRAEAAAHNVRVTTVCPGGIDTPFWRAMDYYPFPDHIDPSRDFLKPEDVAAAVLDVARTSDKVVVPEIVMVPQIPAAP